MGRTQEPYSVIERAGSPFWYYKTEWMAAYKSSGLRKKEVRRKEAEAWARQQWENRHRLPGQTLGAWATPFFTPDCPRVRRFREERRSITNAYIHDSRKLLENEILTDEICALPIAEIRKSDVLDYRSRLIARVGMTRKAQKTMTILGVIFAEAEYRERIDRNPASGIGKIRVDLREPGVFGVEDMRLLFGQCPGPWGTVELWTCFYLAAGTGMRRNEILALRWQDVAGDVIRVDSQFVRGSMELSAPKWGHARTVPIPSKVKAALANWRGLSAHPADADLIFCDTAGGRRGETWWMKGFRRALAAVSIDWESRHLKPHSFRHSLVTRLHSAGRVSQALVMRSVGHLGESVHAEYDHDDMDAMRDVGRAVDEII